MKIILNYGIYLYRAKIWLLVQFWLNFRYVRLIRSSTFILGFRLKHNVVWRIVLETSVIKQCILCSKIGIVYIIKLDMFNVKGLRSDVSVNNSVMFKYFEDIFGEGDFDIFKRKDMFLNAAIIFVSVLKALNLRNLKPTSCMLDVSSSKLQIGMI